MRFENAQPHFVRVGPQGGISQPRLPNPVTCGTSFARDTKALEDHAFSPTPRLLRGGCYLIRFTPVQPDTSSGALRYIGTLRVERNATDTIASGDLYLHSNGTVTKEPNPADGIPVLPRHRYRYYLRVTQIMQGSTPENQLTLGFDRHRFDHENASWNFDGTFNAVMRWTTSPPDYPTSSDYLSGEVTDEAGQGVGTLKMGWVSPFLRRAVIEIDRVAQSEQPNDNGSGIGWRDVLSSAGWDVTVIASEPDVQEPSGESWSNAELHAKMLKRRATSVNLDTEWRYYLLCVRRLDSTSRGIMFDARGTDSNKVPREGASIASHWVIPDTPKWGRVRTLRFGAAAAPYFRTAVHELGHAMGLYHNTIDNGFMNTTGTIASNAPPGEFPNNVRWSHAPDDQKRLRHMPDIWVRPGGIPFGKPFSSTPISPDDQIQEAEGLVLKVSPLLDVVPIGAPVRIHFTLENSSDRALPAPASMSLKAGHVGGKVIGPAGGVRAFSPVILNLDEDKLHMLDPGQSISHWVTLLRGAQGALFASPGVHRVVVEISWDFNGVIWRVDGETNVMVTPSQDEDHARAALKILSTPDALLVLALGGDHLDEGMTAIQTGIENPVLRPHFAIIEAKRVGNRFGTRKVDLTSVSRLLDDNAVLSGAELRRAVQFVQTATRDKKDVAGEKLVKVLKKKSEVVSVDEVA